MSMTMAATAQAAPQLPQPITENKASHDAHPAVTTGEEIERLQSQEVRGGDMASSTIAIGVGVAVTGAGVSTTTRPWNVRNVWPIC
jgi:hypothetical protein